MRLYVVASCTVCCGRGVPTGGREAVTGALGGPTGVVRGMSLDAVSEEESEDRDDIYGGFLLGLGEYARDGGDLEDGEDEEDSGGSASATAAGAS